MFRLLGFDVHVRTGFVLFTGLIVFLYQDAFGFWLAGSIALLTLLHELGHAVAARRAGCTASISLDFLAGYTSFRPTRPLSRVQRATISIAGPFTQIAIALAVLVAMGVNPFSFDSIRQSDAAAAIWWAGPAIGALNLIPVLPLDGGHLAMTGIETFVGKRAPRIMAIASITLTGGVALLMLATGRSDFVIFIVFLLFNQIQILQATSKSGTPQRRRAVDAETLAWQTGQVGVLEPGQRLSPWFEAHRLVSRGDHGGAMGTVLADLRSTAAPKWLPPSAATPEQLRAVVETLPHELPPAGNGRSAQILGEVLLATGNTQRAGEYAAATFANHRGSLLALIVARAAASMRDYPNAVSWLRAAADTAQTETVGHRRAVAQTIETAPEFAVLREEHDLDSIRRQLADQLS